MLIVGTQVRDKRKTHRRHHKNAQNIISGIIPTKRDHRTEQMGALKKMHLRIFTKAHLSAFKRKVSLTWG